MTAAVIVDIVGSRRIEDRPAAQRALDDALAALERDLPGAQVPLHPIVGDEMQGVFGGLDAALRATLLFQLALPDAVQCRFGIGLGPVGEVPSASGGISDGPGWWAARAAIEAVEALAVRAVPSARTRVAASGDDEGIGDAVRRANAYLLARDQLVAGMSERTRRLTHGRCLGRTQRALAAAEGITQSAVSQALRTSGAAAVVAGFRLLQD
ncbi:SatD family protein [Microbacterium luticocti]|uniref:SatD family protein n=1 Tax=Microbacterium luticocti TaxID=451764 RepID=UPI0003FA0F62|nr:SatD family protein [Microbacterium luticocti]